MDRIEVVSTMSRKLQMLHLILSYRYMRSASNFSDEVKNAQYETYP